jgi:hypothetical protein
MNTTSIDESEGQCPLTIYLYPESLHNLVCGSNHLYGGGLHLKLLSLHSKLPNGCALWPNTSLQ